MKLWGGRFEGETDEQADAFHSSIRFDIRLIICDILGSIAHAQMLGRQKIITKKDAAAIEKTLHQILDEVADGKLSIDPKAEDVHSFVETELVRRIGEAGKRLHTGRSRNDQVALDMRMYVRYESDIISELLEVLQQLLVDLAKEHTKTIMPGFTHMQKAQPVTLAHHFLAYYEMFMRDGDRLYDCQLRTNIMPLGSGALASTVYPIDREYVSDKLGFNEITANSLDAVSDRDYCIELLSALSIIMMHLSRFCEELILWSTEAFGFIEISDAFTTGSSIMPQKKNPDMAELIRGKTGRVYGSLITLLTVMKGLPLSYNTDMQEDKEAVFDAIDTVKVCLSVFIKMLKNTTFHKDAMYKSAQGGYTNATDVADWLVTKKKVAFRDAHEIVGKIVRLAIKKGNKPLTELSLKDFQSISEHFDETIFDAITIEASVNARNVPGGPAEATVLQAIEDAEMYNE